MRTTQDLDIATTCTGPPLALRTVGKRLTSRPGHSMAERADHLHRAGTDLDQVGSGEVDLRHRLLMPRWSADGCPAGFAMPRLLRLLAGEQFPAATPRHR
ncbi:hypothetical protein NCC78_29505 [Micromonospora phytophila]|uniref:hypothetical protein n=1 Tax=Micromonospora phytophila TaxID=709888 RepID=UPI0020302F0C|nr:hypothetical protein [Micromonospora phytophila]MCM0678781.1 hypothetical protein [Micromonospora phytophila]